MIRALHLSLISLFFAGTLVAADPNIVRVEAFRGPASEGQVPVAESLGFITESNGFLVTSYKRLVDPETEDLLSVFRVTVREDKETANYAARVIGVEPTLDFALLKIDTDRTFVASTLGVGKTPAIGQELRAVSAFEYAGSPDANGRLLALNDFDCYQENLTAALYRCDLPLPKSAAGTPVFSPDGTVVAVFTGYEPPPDDPAKIDPEHKEEEGTRILPFELLNNVYEGIKQRGSLASPWTGFSVRKLNAEEMNQFPLGGGTFRGGITLEYVWDNSPAAAMGLKAGDFLVRFGQHLILAPSDFQRWLYLYGVGQTVDLTIAHEGQVFIHRYTIEERPEWAVPR